MFKKIWESVVETLERIPALVAGVWKQIMSVIEAFFAYIKSNLDPLVRLVAGVLGVPYIYKTLGPWPGHISVLIAVIALAMEISKLLDRVKSFSFGGHHIDLSVKETVGEPSKRGQGAASQEKVDLHNIGGKDFKNPVRLHYENLLRQELVRRKNEDKNFTDQSIVDYLIELNAKLNVDYTYLDITRLIYPEQKALLKHLNKFSALFSEDLMCFYDQFVQRTGLYTINFDHCIGGLEQSGLIIKVSSDQYSITVMGNDYLKFLVSIRDPDI